MGTSLSHSFASKPVICLAAMALALVLFLLLIAAPVSASPCTYSTSAWEEVCAGSLSSAGAQGAPLVGYGENALKWHVNTISSSKAGQIDVVLALLLLVAWGIASVRSYGKGRDE